MLFLILFGRYLCSRIDFLCKAKLLLVFWSKQKINECVCEFEFSVLCGIRVAVLPFPMKSKVVDILKYFRYICISNQAHGDHLNAEHTCQNAHEQNKIRGEKT